MFFEKRKIIEKTYSLGEIERNLHISYVVSFLHSIEHLVHFSVRNEYYAVVYFLRKCSYSNLQLAIP